LKYINFTQFRFSAILRGLAIAVSMASICAIIFITLGISQTKVEVENYIFDHKNDLGQALVDGDIVHIQSILRALNKFGVESSILDTRIFWGGQSKSIYTGRLDKSFFLIKSKVQIIYNGLELGSLNYRVSLLKVFNNVLDKQWQVLSILFLSNLIIIFLVNSILISELRFIYRTLTKSINDGVPIQDELVSTNLFSRALFSRDLGRAIKLILNEIIELRKRDIDLSIIKTEKAIAKQVAHDIRAPLSALGIVSHKLTGSEEAINLFKLSIQRINSIANDLLKKGNETQNIKSNNFDFQIATAVISLDKIKDRVIHLVNETRLRFPNIDFEIVASDAISSIYIDADLGVLERMISILINNAAESLSGDHSFVKLKIQAQEGEILITVEDNGNGIPINILNRIGEEGLSYGKKDGNGLGLYYVCNATKKMYGEFKINSTINFGTTAILKFRIIKMNLVNYGADVRSSLP
jgi:signal transduction histidine kinase